MKYKKILSWIIVLSMLLSMGVGVQLVFAASPESDFTFDSSSGTITGYTGNDSVVDIPTTIGGVSVKQIMASSSLKSNRVKAGQLLTISTAAEDTKASKHQARETRSGKSVHGKTSSSHIKSSRIKGKSHTRTASVKHKHHK